MGLFLVIVTSLSQVDLIKFLRGILIKEQVLMVWQLVNMKGKTIIFNYHFHNLESVIIPLLGLVVTSAS